MTVTVDIQYVVSTEIQAGIAAGTMTIGGAVRKLRTELANMSQQDFANMCQISLRTLGQIETDTGNPTIHTLAAILSKFGMYITVEPGEKQA